MTDFDVDPFGDDTEVVEAAPVKKAPAKKAAAKAAEGEGKITVTLKGGAGFDAPWIVVHAADLQDAFDQFSGDQAAVLAKLMEKVKAAAQHFTGGEKQVRVAPSAAQEPPADAPDCPPGWTYRSGVSKAGKPYKGFFPPRGDESKPIFFN